MDCEKSKIFLEDFQIRLSEITRDTTLAMAERITSRAYVRKLKKFNLESAAFERLIKESEGL